MTCQRACLPSSRPPVLPCSLHTAAHLGLGIERGHHTPVRLTPIDSFIRRAKTSDQAAVSAALWGVWSLGLCKACRMREPACHALHRRCELAAPARRLCAAAGATQQPSHTK